MPQLKLKSSDGLMVMTVTAGWGGLQSVDVISGTKTFHFSNSQQDLQACADLIYNGVKNSNPPETT